jgi:hypothetical protein
MYNFLNRDASGTRWKMGVAQLPAGAVLRAFKPAFSPRPSTDAQVLTRSTRLTHGRPTMAAALRQRVLSDVPHFSPYHHVRNRTRGPTRNLSRRLLPLFVRTF